MADIFESSALPLILALVKRICPIFPYPLFPHSTLTLRGCSSPDIITHPGSRGICQDLHLCHFCSSPTMTISKKSLISSPKLQTALNWINIKKSNWHQKPPNRREMYVVTYCSFSEEEKITKLLLPLVLTHHILAAGTCILKGVCGFGDVPTAFTCLTAQIYCLELT